MSRLSRMYESILCFRFFSISHSWKKFNLMKRNLMKLSKYHKVQSTLKKYKVAAALKGLKKVVANKLQNPIIDSGINFSWKLNCLAVNGGHLKKTFKFRGTADRKCSGLQFFVMKASENKDVEFLTNNYLFEVNNRNARKRCEICSELTIKAPERRQTWLCLFC